MRKINNQHKLTGSSLKILIWHWGRRGGGPRYTLELARALDARGDVDVALSLSRGCEIYESFSGIGFARFDLDTYTGFGSALLSSVRLWGIRKAFWEFVKSHEIDLVICTMSHLWNVPVIISKPDHPPLVLVLHDAIPHPGENYPFRLRLLRAEVSRCDAIITLSDHVRKTLADRYEYPPSRTFVVPHGIFAYTKPKNLEPRKQIKLLFFGRILTYKGLDLLLEAHRTLLSKGIDVHLKVFGAGSIDAYEPTISNLESITIENRWIDEDEIEEIFDDVDITILPYKEASQSGVIAISFAAGIPVIATPVGGLVEQVSHGINGLISASVSADSIANAIEEMVTDTELRFNCAKGALTTARDELSWLVVADQVVKISNQVCASTDVLAK